MDDDELLAMVKARRGWLKLLEPIDSPSEIPWCAGHEPRVVRFDSRPTELRAGHLVFCVDPDSAGIFAVAEALEDGVTALHDIKATEWLRWLFNVPVRVLAVVEHDRAPHLRVSGVMDVRFSYRALTARKTERIYLALLEAGMSVGSVADVLD
ncbi:MAG: hypothetical protein WKF96_09070 [Solirubrobacteraceae bacterium]